MIINVPQTIISRWDLFLHQDDSSAAALKENASEIPPNKGTWILYISQRKSSLDVSAPSHGCLWITKYNCTVTASGFVVACEVITPGVDGFWNPSHTQHHKMMPKNVVHKSDYLLTSHVIIHPPILTLSCSMELPWCFCDFSRWTSITTPPSAASFIATSQLVHLGIWITWNDWNPRRETRSIEVSVSWTNVMHIFLWISTLQLSPPMDSLMMGYEDAKSS